MSEEIFRETLVFLFGSMLLLWRNRIIVRWIDRRKASSGPDSRALEERLGRIEQIVETTAIEVERVSEAQRFTAKVLTERATDFPAPRSPGRINTPH